MGQLEIGRSSRRNYARLPPPGDTSRGWRAGNRSLATPRSSLGPASRTRGFFNYSMIYCRCLAAMFGASSSASRGPHDNRKATSTYCYHGTTTDSAARDCLTCFPSRWLAFLIPRLTEWARLGRIYGARGVYIQLSKYSMRRDHTFVD